MPSLRARVIRILPLGLAACALAALVVQNATVVALGDSDPDTAARVWPGHPSVNSALASREIASASGSGRSIDPSAFAMLEQAARAAPIEPQPFIVAGIRAQLAGRQDAAETAFEAARLRDPRSLPARYFLAASKLQRGDVEGLRDVAALARLAPGGVTNIAPYLAAFVQQQQAWGPIRAMFRNNPGVRGEVLSTLARDPANLRLVLALGNTVDRLWLRLHGLRTPPAYFAEDAAGLVALTPEPDDPKTWRMSVNGRSISTLPFGGVHSHLGAVPAVMHPDPRHIAVIGLGSGDTAWAAGLRPGTERIRVYEICAPQLALLRRLAAEDPPPKLRRFLRDRRFEFRFEDGRNALERGDRLWDVIETDALLPYSAGSGNVYSREFFEGCARRLAPGGLISPPRREKSSVYRAPRSGTYPGSEHRGPRLSPGR